MRKIGDKLLHVTDDYLYCLRKLFHIRLHNILYTIIYSLFLWCNNYHILWINYDHYIEERASIKKKSNKQLPYTTYMYKDRKFEFIVVGWIFVLVHRHKVNSVFKDRCSNIYNDLTETNWFRHLNLQLDQTNTNEEIILYSIQEVH